MHNVYLLFYIIFLHNLVVLPSNNDHWTYCKPIEFTLQLDGQEHKSITIGTAEEVILIPFDCPDKVTLYGNKHKQFFVQCPEVSCKTFLKLKDNLSNIDAIRKSILRHLISKKHTLNSAIEQYLKDYQRECPIFNNKERLQLPIACPFFNCSQQFWQKQSLINHMAIAHVTLVRILKEDIFRENSSTLCCQFDSSKKYLIPKLDQLDKWYNQDLPSIKEVIELFTDLEKTQPHKRIKKDKNR